MRFLLFLSAFVAGLHSISSAASTACRDLEYHGFGFGAALRLDSASIRSPDTLRSRIRYEYDSRDKLTGISQTSDAHNVRYAVSASSHGFEAIREGDTIISLGKYFGLDFRLDSSRGHLYRQRFRYSDSGYVITDNDQGVFETADSVSYMPWGQLHFRRPGMDSDPDSCFAKTDTCVCRNAGDPTRNSLHILKSGLVTDEFIDFDPDLRIYSQHNTNYWGVRSTSVRPRAYTTKGIPPRYGPGWRADGRKTSSKHTRTRVR